MLKKLINKPLSLLGYRLVGLPPDTRKRVQRGGSACMSAILQRIRVNPSDAIAHADLAGLASRQKRWFFAHAQARTSHSLDPENSGFLELARASAIALPPLTSLSHNTYHRMDALARILRANGYSASSSVLDIGGGNGELAAFLPDAPYFLADPSTNGLGSDDLSYLTGEFDYVVSCHVLEHLEVSGRDAFLDSLVSRMRCAVVLLNPFHIDDSFERDRLRLVIELTDADWAKEHLQCSLPYLSEIKDYAARNGLQCTYEPIGAMTTTMAYIFVEHFARRAEMPLEMRRVNEFFNSKLCHAEQSEGFPTGYAVVLKY